MSRTEQSDAEQSDAEQSDAGQSDAGQGDAGQALSGPKGWPLLGSAGALRHGVLTMFERWWRTYGDIYRVKVGGQVWTIVVHPDGVRDILHAGRRQFVKGPIYDQFRLLGGEGLVSSDGDRWLRDRRLMQPTFLRKNLPQFFDNMAVAVDDSLARLAAIDGPVAIQDEMIRLALRMVGEALFGMDLTDEADATGPAMHAALEVISDRGNAALNLPMWLPTPANRRLKRSLGLLHEAVDLVVAEGRSGGEASRPTLLRQLIEARDPETGEHLDDANLRDQIITLFVAGHETTALTLTWALHLLGLHPEVQASVRAEVDRVLDAGPLTAMRLGELTELRMVVDEVLRVRPPLWAVARNCVEGTTVLGHHIPEGAVVILPIYLIHRHPDAWTDPETFDPQRFSAARSADRHRFAYLPFSVSARRCIGDNFALMEILLALAMILRRFEVGLPDPSAVDVNPHLTLRPARPVVVSLEARHD